MFFPPSHVLLTLQDLPSSVQFDICDVSFSKAEDMHFQARHFLQFVRAHASAFFTDAGVVLDVGSGDINGNNRDLFPVTATYVGNDMVPGPNVTAVCKTSALPFPANTFDVVVSSECFEHDPEWRESLVKIWDMLKPCGLFFFTCAGTGRGEHGTRRTSPECSLAAAGGIEVWNDHYLNLTAELVTEVFNGSLPEKFSSWAFYENRHSCDLYFWGIKVGDEVRPALPTYTAPGVILKQAREHDVLRLAQAFTYTYTYGSDIKSKDVTVVVHDMLARGHMDIPVSNAVFGDPHFGVVKHLAVLQDGKRIVHVIEGDVMQFPTLKKV